MCSVVYKLYIYITACDFLLAPPSPDMRFDVSTFYCVKAQKLKDYLLKHGKTSTGAKVLVIFQPKNMTIQAECVWDIHGSFLAGGYLVNSAKQNSGNQNSLVKERIGTSFEKATMKVSLIKKIIDEG